MLGGILVVCGDCYNLNKIIVVVVLSPHLTVLILKTKMQGMSLLAGNGKHVSSLIGRAKRAPHWGV